MVCKRVGSWTLGRSLIVENLVEYPSAYRAIFVWPWHENALTKQEQQTNRNRAIWLAYRTDTNARGFWLVKRTLRWKNVIPENFLKINRYFALTSYCNTIGQSNNAFSILGFSLAGKRRGHVFIKQITNTYRNHFSRSYKNCSIYRFHFVTFLECGQESWCKLSNCPLFLPFFDYPSSYRYKLDSMGPVHRNQQQIHLHIHTCTIQWCYCKHHWLHKHLETGIHLNLQKLKRTCILHEMKRSHQNVSSHALF